MHATFGHKQQRGEYLSHQIGSVLPLSLVNAQCGVEQHITYSLSVLCPAQRASKPLIFINWTNLQFLAINGMTKCTDPSEIWCVYVSTHNSKSGYQSSWFCSTSATLSISNYCYY